MNAVSLTPHAKYDTTCTIDERFKQPWEALKGISKTYVFPKCPTPIYNFKGDTQKMFVHALSLTPHARFLRSKIGYLSANSKQNSKKL
jgi:hypothetical protein